ncbi:MAG: helicase, partial [Verrucomicrobia bacterium]|nr:helicase [Verrucomicrobiota bacterium]
MTFDLDQRTVALSAGEFAGFSIGPHAASSGGAAGLWRAQLGTHWHRELRSRALADYGADAAFEVPVSGRLVHREWTFTFGGRVDQVVRSNGRLILREIKSVTCPLPAEETFLRSDYPAYFAQLATYANLARLGLATIGTPAVSPATATRPLPAEVASSGKLAAAELVFVEADSGLTQVVPLTAADDAAFQTQLDRVREFLELRRRARQRLQRLRFRPAFAVPRPGQETTRAELTALFHRHPLVLFEAPTGFGKTGVLLEFALDQLRSGHFDRALYLTGKSTGQLQVIRTLQAMTAPESTGDPAGVRAGTPVAAWLVRNKGEHCINSVFHCVREACACLEGAGPRWAQSGLARFYLDEQQARDLETLRAAGAAARLCPYEITRAALAFNDLWIGDYNYVFAPRNRSLFYEQPGFVPGRTLVLIDEAHNLPARVADAYSHDFSAADARAVLAEFHRLRPAVALVAAWSHWCDYLDHLRVSAGLSPAAEDDARHLLSEIAARLPAAGLDFAALGPFAADLVWRVPTLLEELVSAELPRLWWSPHDGHLTLTCLDAAAAIGAALREFGGVVLASATLEPVAEFAAACGLATPPGIRPALPPAA